jgi:RNA polymerase sporulation-specific sigma factor
MEHKAQRYREALCGLAQTGRFRHTMSSWGGVGMLETLLLALRELWLLFSYVSDRKSFPQPLSPPDEAQYIQLMHKGDENARAKLIEHNQRLVAHIAKKYQNVNIDMQDLISIGTIGLIKAVETYRPGNTALATYAARCIDNEILMTVRMMRRTRLDVSIYEPIGTDKDGCEISLMDILPGDDDDIIEQVEKRIEVARIGRMIMKELDGREQMVMRLRYGMDDGIVKAQREVARQLGISRSYVSRIETKAIAKLKAKLNAVL